MTDISEVRCIFRRWYRFSNHARGSRVECFNLNAFNYAVHLQVQRRILGTSPQSEDNHEVDDVLSGVFLHIKWRFSDS